MKNRIINIIFCIILLSVTFQSMPAKANNYFQGKSLESVSLNKAAVDPPQVIKPDFQFPLSEEADHYDFEQASHQQNINLEGDILNESYMDHFWFYYPNKATGNLKEEQYNPPSAEVIAETQAQVRSFDCGTVTDVSQIECEALVDFYESTNGAGWLNASGWLVSTIMDNWYGVTVENRSVVGLGLGNNILTGTIPPDLVNLSNLEYLYLNTNYIPGPIPRYLGSMSSLIGLDLSGMGLTGSIPIELTNLSNLDHLLLYGNQLTGNIPPELGKMSKLSGLLLMDNELTGIIPSELGNLPYLQSLVLEHNQLTGTIPSTFGNLTNLWALSLSYNKLTGSIPPELGNLSKLEKLYLDHNYFSGDLPPELGSLNLWEFYIHNNPLLSGSIPLSFVSLSLLQVFNFSDTPLCEPTTPEFLAWKATVSVWYGSGIICEDSSWLLMYYLDGDNNLDFSYEEIFNHLEFSAGKEGVTIVALWDGSILDDSAYYEIKHDSDLNNLASYKVGFDKWPFDELNMGDPQTLINFLHWAMTDYPADNYALIFDDHGSGLGGSMIDETSNDDKLTLSETKSALSTAFSSSEKLDVLVMNACLMGLFEAGYQFRDIVSYYVASENLQWIFDKGYKTTIDNISIGSSSIEVAYAFVDGYADQIDPRIFFNTSYTMSVADLSKTDILRNAIETFAAQLLSNMPNLTVWDIVQNKVQRFPHNDDYESVMDEIYIDLYHLAQEIINETTSQDVIDASQNLIDVINMYIVYNRSSFDDAHGVSIFFPDMKSSYYDGNNNDFASGTIWNTDLTGIESVVDGEPIGWGNFLVQLFEEIDPDGPDDPNEPEPIPKPELVIKLFLPMMIK